MDEAKILEKLETIGQDIAVIKTKQETITLPTLHKLERCIYGNGEKGLVAKVECNSLDIRGIWKRLDELPKNIGILATIFLGIATLLWAVIQHFSNKGVL